MQNKITYHNVTFTLSYVKSSIDFGISIGDALKGRLGRVGIFMLFRDIFGDCCKLIYGKVV